MIPVSPGFTKSYSHYLASCDTSKDCQHQVQATTGHPFPHQQTHNYMLRPISRIQIHSFKLPAKNLEYFLFHQFFAFLWGVQGVSVFEIHSYEQLLLLRETMVRILIVPLSDCCHIHLFVCCIEILRTIPSFIYRIFWCGQQGISVMGASHKRTWGVVLVYHQVMYTNLNLL